MTKLSRTRLELFLDCPRCFWLTMHGVAKRPSGAPYTINIAIDALLKREFDECRYNNLEHWIIKKNKIKARPFDCEEIDQWRHNFTGVQFEDRKNDFLVYGAVDDVWVNPKGELIVVDYKATGAKEHKIYDSYKRQMEVYQWLLRKNGRKVSDTGYFLFCKANKEHGFPEGKLTFDLILEPLKGNSRWVPGAIRDAKKCFDKKKPPAAAKDCEYCPYVKAARV
jgi:hypothetical protein